MKQFTSLQETLQTREQSLGDLQVRYDELQARLDELQGEAASREDAIQALQNEKIVLEVALQAAHSSREEFDRGVKRLEEGAQDTSDTLEQLRQELAIKSSQVTQLLSLCYEWKSCIREVILIVRPFVLFVWSYFGTPCFLNMEEHLQGRAQGSVGKGSIASSVVLPVLGQRLGVEMAEN